MRNADQALWQEVAAACENGVKPIGANLETQFEIAWKIAVVNPKVLACLQFLPGAAATRTQGQPENELSNLKRRLEQAEANLKKARDNRRAPNAPPSGGGKGRGKGKGGRSAMAPKDLGNFSAKTPAPESLPICFAYNRTSGCPLARAGERCNKGKHVCIKCYGVHPLYECR